MQIFTWPHFWPQRSRIQAKNHLERSGFLTTVLTTTTEKMPGICGVVSSGNHVILWINVLKRAEKIKKITEMPLGAGCRKFESCHSDHKSPKPLIQSVSDFYFFLLKRPWKTKGSGNRGFKLTSLLPEFFVFRGKSYIFMIFRWTP